MLHREDMIDGEEFNEKIVEVIIQYAKEIIPKSAGSTGKNSVLCWDENCRQVIKRRKMALKQFLN